MGKGGGKARASSPSRKVLETAGPGKSEILLNGKYVDVVDFEKSHPGGSVIKFYMGNGVDATQAYSQFHVRSKKADMRLKALLEKSSREADPIAVEKTRLKGQTKLLDDFNKLTEELKAKGFFKPAPLHIFYRISELLIMHAIGLYMLFNSNTEYQIPIAVAGIFILGLASGRCGWLMHEGGHYSLTGSIPVDKALQVIIYGVGCGMSGSFWRNQHNKHHSMPQKAEHDVDLNTLPLVAFTQKIDALKRAGKFLKKWIHLQAVLFPVITTFLVAIGWQLFTHPRHSIRTKNWFEVASMATRYVLWHKYITGHFGVAMSAGIYCLYNWFAANYIFINFAVSHTHLPVVSKEDNSVDWVRYAAIHTMNVNPGPLRFVDWWMSFLNYQIEHHLWPSMPQYNHPETSKYTRKLFEENGLHYDSRDYFASVAACFRNLDKVGNDVYYG
jgi:fatty acid desaturase 2 (delta-6 desaturase)